MDVEKQPKRQLNVVSDALGSPFTRYLCGLHAVGTGRALRLRLAIPVQPAAAKQVYSPPAPRASLGRPRPRLPCVELRSLCCNHSRHRHHPIPFPLPEPRQTVYSARAVSPRPARSPQPAHQTPQHPCVELDALVLLSGVQER